MEALLSGDIARIIGETCAIMDDSISVNDAKEDFYHGMLVGVLRTLCSVKSRRIEPGGRNSRSRRRIGGADSRRKRGSCLWVRAFGGAARASFSRRVSNANRLR